VLLNSSRILRAAFGPKSDYVIGGWRDTIFNSLARCIPHQIKSRRMSWAGHLAGMGMKCIMSIVKTNTPAGKRALRCTRHKWVYITKMDFR
jgi:hypothetical protein